MVYDTRRDKRLPQIELRKLHDASVLSASDVMDEDNAEPLSPF